MNVEILKFMPSDFLYILYFFVTLGYVLGRKAKIHLIGNRTPRIVLDGFIYGINRRYQNKTFWLCSSYTKTKCTARVQTSGSTAKLSNDHNHAPLSDTKFLENNPFKIVTILDKKKELDTYINKILVSGK